MTQQLLEKLFKNVLWFMNGLELLVLLWVRILLICLNVWSCLFYFFHLFATCPLVQNVLIVDFKIFRQIKWHSSIFYFLNYGLVFYFGFQELLLMEIFQCLVFFFFQIYCEIQENVVSSFCHCLAILSKVEVKIVQELLLFYLLVQWSR